MEWQSALLLLVGGLILLMALGLPVVFAFIAINLVGAYVFMGGEMGIMQMARNSAEAITSFSLIPIPLFVLMGEVLFHTGLAYKAITAIERLIKRVPGRLSIVSVLGGTAFATLSGSSIANTAMMGSSLLPDMLKRGYHPSIAMGPIMAVGGIAMLIPPSALAVTLGSLAGISIGQLLIGGIIPGILMGAAVLMYVMIRCTRNPDLAPADDGDHSLTAWQRWQPFCVYVLPLSGIFVAVVGSLLAGWAEPTESAAFGAVAATLAALCYRCLTKEALSKSLMETAKVSVMILFVLVASTTFSQLLSFSGATNGLLKVVTGWELTPLMVVLGMLLVLLVLGCFADQISMIMITLPFFMPLVASLGIDPIWIGVLFLVAMEISFLTPPFGLLLIVMQGVAPPGIRLTQVYQAALPFLLLQMLVLALVVALPWLATGLPSLMK
ncbi:TRAP transporter large permease [Halomonas sp. MCCC 1A17488]|uniref:TRAP transporter large permease protein n=1 Tax=Billgrantia sulfidoxydans TaxID=2733484 RepID=A0ABX7W267_9GAMM|nr:MULTISPECIES: TRAP transporter large permease [Halomonas]MCE8015784.1 TRAP transporter large permease [Halomonas sp. MCCC 1A17488]MCG3239117.1 TRAP transporter large permease [Halomonas sp. MCCC 1A17488]QPP50939.1 TRAP transporter large permease [Halomonas sp. SS10-MC5]QTP54454.1 TRAP transporter large permease [Halomonas sulfidoxydans]